MTARLGRAVANGRAAPSAKAVRRDTPAAKAFRSDEDFVSDDLCNNEAVHCCSICRELAGGTELENSDLCARDGVFCCAIGL